MCDIARFGNIQCMIRVSYGAEPPPRGGKICAVVCATDGTRESLYAIAFSGQFSPGRQAGSGSFRPGLIGVFETRAKKQARATDAKRKQLISNTRHISTIEIRAERSRAEETRIEKIRGGKTRAERDPRQEGRGEKSPNEPQREKSIAR